jgi:hypothetical protein
LTLPTAKLSAREKKETAAWLPYYAGYSREFVRASIAALGLSSEHCVLDAWSGSGTTGIVCQEQGVRCISVEINPIAAYIAGSRMALYAGNEKLVKNLTPFVEHLARRLKNEALSDGRSLHLEVSRRIRSTEASSFDTLCNAPRLSAASCMINGALASAVHKSAESLVTKNPSWRAKSSIEFLDPAVISEQLLDEWSRITAESSHYAYGDLSAQTIGDSRALAVKSRSIDAIICSPPYLTRIDYAMSTRLEHDWLLGPETLRSVREATMGAPIIRPVTGAASISGLAANVLAEVDAHPSYAAKRYYGKTYRQYFEDCLLSMREIHRTLKKGAIALVVVQNSHFKDVEIPLGEIYVDMWNENFGASEIFSRYDVLNSMVRLNKNAKKHLPIRDLHEDVVALYK